MKAIQSIVLLSVFSMVVVGCGISKEVYKKDVGNLRDQIKGLETTNADLYKQRGKLTQDLSKCTNELAALKSQGAQMDANLAAALKRIQELQAIAAAQQAVFDKLRRELDSLVRAGKLSIAIVRGQFTVQMSDKILFDSGKYDIKPGAEETLKELTRILSGLEGRMWQVAGHTDSDGGADYNARLSGNRSRAVSQFMIENGMPPERLSFAGYGEFAPTAANDTPENKALNRRIEIVLIPDLEALLGPLKPTLSN